MSRTREVGEGGAVAGGPLLGAEGERTRLPQADREGLRRARSPLTAPGVLGQQAGSFCLPEPGLTPWGALARRATSVSQQPSSVQMEVCATETGASWAIRSCQRPRALLCFSKGQFNSVS